MDKKLLQLNVTANWGSTGKIAEGIGKKAKQYGLESWIAYGRGNPNSESNLIRIGNDIDVKFHGLQSRLLDNHGLASRKATEDFIKRIKFLSPDIIHLHNIHGYYLNYPILFDFLKEWGGPVVWTLHDCWPWTGHCAYYSYIGCNLWKTKCQHCPQIRSYPSSLWFDNSSRNFELKRKMFQGIKNLTLVPVSHWLRQELSQSFLKEYSPKTIHNGIDISIFKPSKSDVNNRKEKIVLGVASIWEKRKGLEEFIELRKILPKEYRIILVGVSAKQKSLLPDGITGISRTENINQLVDLYSKANVFVNPTFEDNFPTTNLEALACGTPVVTYQTGGSPEAIDDITGMIVETGNVKEMAEAIRNIIATPQRFSRLACRKRVEENFNEDIQYSKYIELYNQLLKN